MTFIIEGHSISVQSHKPYVDLVEFQRFLDTSPIKSLPFVKTWLADVTGDGIDDSCVTEISLVNGLPFVENSIYSRGISIWLDTLSLRTVSVSTTIWGDDTSYVRLMPYSGLFTASKYFADLVGDSVDVTSANFSYFISVLHPNQKSEFIRRYHSFHAHWIWYLDLSDPGGMIWDKTQGKFILYWAS
ncbi:MAG: hypothetical protein WBD36_04110 [Bacteroidota bacterium]